MSLSSNSSDSSESEAASVASSDGAVSDKEISTDKGETYSSVSEVTTGDGDNSLIWRAAAMMMSESGSLLKYHSIVCSMSALAMQLILPFLQPLTAADLY